MDYRNIIAFATVLFATGYLVRSFQPANAFPQGPNISMGLLPIESWAGNISNATETLLTTSSPFIISDIILTMTNPNCDTISICIRH